MTLQTLLAWWNLIFVMPFGLALVYLGLYTLTGIGLGDADAEAGGDADAEIDHDVDANADHDTDADSGDGDGDADADSDHDAASAAEPDHADAAPSHGGVLSFLGIGHVPMGFLAVAMLMVWGATGFIVNQILATRYGDGPRLAAASAPAAALASLLVLRAVTVAVNRWVPLNASSARRRHELLGSTGEALFSITETFGLAAVRDDCGELFQVPCRVEPGDTALPKGARVLLVGYSGSGKSFYVRPVAEVNASVATGRTRV